jgi:hypothetical protein
MIKHSDMITYNDLVCRLSSADFRIWEMKQVIQQRKEGLLSNDQMLIQFNKHLYAFNFEYESLEKEIDKFNTSHQ